MGGESGRPLRFEREEFYRTLWSEHTDHFGVITSNLSDLAEKLDVERALLSRMLSEYVDTKRMKRVGRNFQLRNPDSFSWDEEWNVEAKAARMARYSPSRRELVFGKKNRVD